MKARENLTLQINSQTYQEHIWIIGDGRSGTTWLQEAINFDQSYRQVFEPFHPREVEVMCNENFFKYLRPDQEDESFEKLCYSVFNGTFSHSWSTSINNEKLNDTRLYRGLLVKDVFAHLFAKWAKNKFPRIKIILILRHPFAVALSKQKLSHWHWMTEPNEFLNQEKLCQDYLEPFIDLIEQANGYFEKQVVIWSIIHHVIFNQFKNGEILPVFYEELCLNFEKEIKEIYLYIKGDLDSDIKTKLISKEIGLSRTSIYSNSEENIREGFNAWTSKISKSDLEAGMNILKRFNFDGIYDEGAFPKQNREKNLMFKR